MPTLLEKPAPAQGHSPVEVLHSRHRWERWRGVLVTLVTGLAATFATLIALHPSWHTPGQWTLLACVWLGGIVLTAGAAIVAWRLAPASLIDTAQGMDRNLAAKNRLEAAAALHQSSSPLAKAQRDETAAYLQQEPRVRPVRVFSWLVGGLLALIIVHLLTLLVWVVPLLFRPPTPVPPPPPKEMPRATIVWKSPEPETKANPIEEVPTVAVAQSTTGLKNLTLEISVNGEDKKSTPLPAKPYDAAGKNTIKISLYMDELGVQPFDVVSYFLRGQRITDQKVPDTTSAIQFIQVRPFRDDVTQLPPGDGEVAKSYGLLIRLKLAELKSIKENFILAHTDLPVNDPTRMKENDRVGKNQGDLSAKTEEVVQNFIQNGYPASIVDLLRQAEAPMTDASKKILATQNVQALPPQQKALSLIIEVEKFFVKVIMPPTKPAPPDTDPKDPFKDKQQHDMKLRAKTTAGQLEQLAKNQDKLSRDLDQSDSTGASGAPSPSLQKSPAPDQPANGTPSPSPSPGSQDGAPGTPNPTPGDDGKMVPLPTPQSVDPFQPDTGKGTFAERQARVLQGIETLLNTNDVLPPAVNSALEDARKHATASIHQLDQGNETAAREPATEAAQDLHQAIAEMNKAGDKDTKLAMEQAQAQLNDLAQKLNDLAQTGTPGSPQPDLSKMAAQVRDVRKQLEANADHQQEAGSGADAQKLNNLANDIGKQKVAPNLDAMAKSGLDVKQAQTIAQTLQNLGAEAANGMLPGKPSPQDIANLINALEKSRANLAHLADKANGANAKLPGQTPGADQTGQQPGDQHQSPTPGAGKDPQPGDQQGQKPGQDQGHGQKPDGQKDQGQQPGQAPGQDQGQQPDGQKGQAPGQDQGQGQKPDGQKGEGQGQGEGQKPDPQQGQGDGQTPGKDQQQKGQQGQGGQGQNSNPDQQADNPPGDSQGGGGHSTAHPLVSVKEPHAPSQTPDDGGGANGNGTDGAEGAAYREVLVDLKNELQQATILVPPSAASQDATAAITLEDNHFRETHVANVVTTYKTVFPPLGQVLTELKAMLAQAQREDLVKQPDLDDAPPSYRPAVSDYFETMSRDYHPDGADQDPKKP